MSSVNEYDPIIRVDRTVRPTVYPKWTRKILHPEFELAGPDKFSVVELKKRFHPQQEDGKVVGFQEMYKFLISIDLIKCCINLADLIYIQARGINFFRRHFPEEALFAWASIVQSQGGGLYVPCLVERDDEVAIVWQLLIIGILPRIPILCHAKK